VDVPIELPAAPDPDPYRDPISLAVVSEVCERGERASADGVIARAGITPAEFHARFTTLEDCALDTFERVIADYKRRIGEAFNSRSGWRDSLRAAAYATADFMDQKPETLHYGMTGVLQLKSELARVRREETFIFCGELIDRGREEPGCLVGANEPVAMFAIGSIIQLLTYRMQSGEPIEAQAMVPEMMFAVVRTYLGEEVAREELEFPADAYRASPR
jgi:AcrR family transcriptional regulator